MELKTVCEELRHFIISQVSQHPGHLGSNLGTIELTVALHYVFDTPYDRIIWDVGHQAYAHKIITGRRDKFHTNRQLGGISGFPLPTESDYDSFGTGHSSTSISAGLGISVASFLKNEEKRQVVAVIGDGAMTGGLAFEGLNNASMDASNLLIVLNDNQMAIDPIKGGFTQYLLDITTSKTYNHLRYSIYKILKRFGLISEAGKKRIISLNNTLKAIFSKQHNIFEGLNIRYFGPADGHDVQGLIKVLSEIKNFSGPKVLHILPKKVKDINRLRNRKPDGTLRENFVLKPANLYILQKTLPIFHFFKMFLAIPYSNLRAKTKKSQALRPPCRVAVRCALCKKKCLTECSMWELPKDMPLHFRQVWQKKDCCRFAIFTRRLCSALTTI